MTEQPPILAEKTASVRPDLTYPRLEPLLRALNRLKSDISGVEAHHPGLGNELSSLCETVIAELNSFYSDNEEGQKADRDNLKVSSDKQAAIPDLIPRVKHGANPVLSAIDKAGGQLITGLDKAGDGIIFILGKLFANHLPEANPGTLSEADLLNR